MSVVICSPHRVVEGPAGPRVDTITVEWMRARMALMSPFGWNWIELACHGLSIDAARTYAVQHCIEHKVPYLFFLDDDVIPPAFALHQLCQRMLNNPDVDFCSGVYCCKSAYPTPLIYVENGGNGVHWDWTLGDVLIDGITGCGFGCCLVRVSAFERMPNTEEQPWFRTTYEQTPGSTKRETEDMYAMCRARKELGSKILIDTNILCKHQDKVSGLCYSLPPDCLPMKRYEAIQEATRSSNSASEGPETSNHTIQPSKS